MLTLRVTDLARGGAGVARDETGRVIFIPLTAPGDLVRVEIVDSEKNYAQGRLLEVLEPSPQRITPKCPVFGRCGGCQWQHLPYSLQWETKLKGVRHALSRVLVDPGALEELPAEQIWEYRNRIQLRGFKDKLGFFAAGTNEVIPADRCEIARSEINSEWESIRTEGSRLPQAFKVEVDVDLEGKVRKAWNSKHAALGFRQVHDGQNRKLQEWVSQALTPGRVLYDLFGGSGNLSLGIQSRMSRIHCVDIRVPRENPAENFQFHRASVLDWLWKRPAPEAGAPAASAILDPPRIGLGSEFAAIEKALTKLGVTEVVAVGCDPDSWARDVSRFIKRGWKLEKAAVLDLFPQTPHVESLAVITR